MTLPQKNRIARVANWLAISVGSFVALLLPLGYFAVSYQHNLGSLEAEAQINSRILSDIINANPEYWHFEQLRLTEVMKRRPLEGVAETRQVLDLENRVIAAHVDPLTLPLITRQYDLKDSGITVARIEISRSLMPLLSRTGILALFSLLIGISIYLIIRVLPFRALIQAEDALRESEERHRIILQTAMDGVWRVDQQGRLLEVNEAYCRMSGYNGQELLTMSIGDVESAETATETAAHLQKVITKVNDRFESKHRHKTGGCFDVEISVQYKSAEGGEFVVFLRDISERKRTEEKHEKLQAQLIQAQKMESVGRLAGGVAHDFNNMLTVIIGHAEMALTVMNPEQPLYERLQEIRKAAERSADLTRQLLAFARKQTVVPRVLDLNETVAGMLKMLRRLIGEDIDLVWLPGENLSPLMMDPSQIDQLLANLCINSRDAVAGTGRIIIETTNVTLDAGQCADHGAYFIPGEYLLLSVSDTGCGMGKETLTSIFEPFFTTKGVGQGTGLGLSTVYGIVKQNNGFIEVSSEPGRGTAFSIYLPRHTGTHGQLPTDGTRETISRGDETVLLVEDEPTLLAMGKMMLESLGYRVLAANSPDEAIVLAGKHGAEIELLITDVIMPGMNGQDLATQLLSIKPGLKQLFMSGYTANIISDCGVLNEKVNFIQKPFSIKNLADKVRQALG